MEFNSFEEAINTVFSAQNESEEWREAMAYVVTNAPPALKKVFDDAFREFFDLEPDYYDDQGNPYWEVEKTRKYFGLSRDEVDEMTEKHPDIVKTAEGLHKVQ